MTKSSKKQKVIEPVWGRDLLFEILGWRRPHDSQTEIGFAREYLDIIPGMEQDAFGNRYLRIGKSNVMWSCHIDTVSSKGGWQRLKFNPKDGVVELDNGKAGQSLGADDGAGVWIMLEMIRHNRPGLYVFHRGEERGCLGSGWLKKNRTDLFEGIDAAVAFDRAHYGDVITHQSFGRTCSEAFAKSMAEQLNALDPAFVYRPDDSGVYTDTNEYAADIPECTNLSVGYFSQHGPRETLNVYHVEALCAAMLKFDTSKLVIERDPSVHEYRDWYGGNYGGYSHFTPVTNKEQLHRLCEDHPDAVAELLDQYGVLPEDIEDIVGAQKRQLELLNKDLAGEEDEDVITASEGVRWVRGNDGTWERQKLRDGEWWACAYDQSERDELAQNLKAAHDEDEVAPGEHDPDFLRQAADASAWGLSDDDPRW